MSSVYVKIVGGIGNQLFQVASGYAYSQEYDKRLIIDASQWTAHQGSSPLSHKNNIFQNIDHTTRYTKNVMGIFETTFNYKKLPDRVGDVELNGYFQSLKYFENYQQQFKDLLVLPEVKTDFIQEKNVAFHIRRGDYLQFRNIHYVCDTEYFNKCFDMFKGYQINVFTDSPEHVLEEFKHQDFNLIQTSSELNDLTLMSLHDNIVISNSSFSWWASFLGKKKERIISPSKWFADGREATDIFRNEFIRI